MDDEAAIISMLASHNRADNSLNMAFGEIIVKAGLRGSSGHVWPPGLSLPTWTLNTCGDHARPRTSTHNSLHLSLVPIKVNTKALLQGAAMRAEAAPGGSDVGLLPRRALSASPAPQSPPPSTRCPPQLPHPSPLPPNFPRLLTPRRSHCHPTAASLLFFFFTPPPFFASSFSAFGPFPTQHSSIFWEESSPPDGHLPFFLLSVLVLSSVFRSSFSPPPHPLWQLIFTHWTQTSAAFCPA